MRDLQPADVASRIYYVHELHPPKVRRDHS